MIDTAGDVNNVLIITGYWIYDYDYKRPLTLIKESQYIICYPSKDEKGVYAEFKDFTVPLGT